jgi:hypothetical protein
MTTRTEQILQRLMGQYPDATALQILELAEPELNAYAQAQQARNLAAQARKAEAEAVRQAQIRAAHPDALHNALQNIRRRRAGR